MRTFRNVPSAERFLRKLCDDPCTIDIRITHHSQQQRSGRFITATSIRVAVKTADGITADSQPQPQLHLAVVIVWRAIIAERTARASQRNAEAIKRLALNRPEVQR